MQLKGEQTLPLNQQLAWQALNDTDLLRASIPGCESITPIAAEGEGAATPNAYDLVMVAAIGPVKAKFKGRLELVDLDPPNAYTIRFQGSGGVAGFGKGSAAVKLVWVEGDRTTRLDYEASATIGGKIAQIGSRLVDMAARKIASNFFENFVEALEARKAV